MVLMSWQMDLMRLRTESSLPEEMTDLNFASLRHLVREWKLLNSKHESKANLPVCSALF